MFNETSDLEAFRDILTIELGSDLDFLQSKSSNIDLSEFEDIVKNAIDNMEKASGSGQKEKKVDKSTKYPDLAAKFQLKRCTVKLKDVKHSK